VKRPISGVELRATRKPLLHEWPRVAALTQNQVAVPVTTHEMTEISTLITDYLLAAFTMPLALILLSRACLPTRLWGCALVASALAAFAGGTWHGFQLLLAEDVLFWLWKAVVYLVGVFGLAAVSGSIIAEFSGGLRNALLIAIFATAAFYAVFMVTHDDFNYVIYFNAIAMVFVLAIHSVTAVQRRDPASPWMIAGIAVSGLGAIVQASGLTLHPHFNNNDIFHVIQLAGIYILFRGAGLLNKSTARARTKTAAGPSELAR
jgi:Family of unknown function (DUF6962)